MRCVISPLGRHSAARLTLFMAQLGLGWSVLGTGACSVDNGGLGSTSPKLAHDGGLGGTVAMTDGAGQDLASNGGAGGAGGAAIGGTGGAATGTAGITGTAGMDGVAGTSGAAGSNGFAGTSGAAGTNGIAGDNGTAGTSGFAGTNGGAGTNGTAGTNGMAGGAGGAAGRAGAGGSAAAGGSSGGKGGVGGGAGGRGGLGGGMGGRGGSCTPSNCAAGCCANNQCVHSLSAQQCGTLGAACAPCSPCQLCSTKGQCAIDPASQWVIVADSAQLSKNPSGGNTWDPVVGDEGGSAPDPFCEFENPAGDITTQTAGVTSTITDTFTPTWSQVITPAGLTISASALMANNPAWRIWVGDEDCSTLNKPSTCGVGQTACSYQQTIPASALQSGMLTVSNFQSCVSLTVSFRCQAPTTAASP